MKFENQTIEEKSINAIRLLSADAIQKANSGHPGLPMGCAPLAFWLYSNAMKHNPKNPNWKNRDRFVLSGGHGSMLLYSALHLSGYDISMDDIKNFRQWGSVTPGHPEFGLTPGVETTTGPLGQGFANAVGMAVAEKFLAAKFNKENFELLNHKIYTLMGDGDMMEGLSHEAASFAGRNKLDNLIAFYDNNSITIEGRTSLAFTEDVAKRFESYDWFVQRVSDINDLKQLDAAIKNAKATKGKPSLIIVDSVIGYGSPNKKDTAGIHGSPLGEEELRLTKENLGWDPDKSFFVPEEVYEYFEEKTAVGAAAEEEWNKLFIDYKNKFPKETELFENIFAGNFGDEWKKNLPEFNEFGSKIATRSASGKVINALKDYLPAMIGGSADLAPSNNTLMNGEEDFSAENFGGRNLHFGIREFAMAAIMNGMEYYGGVVTYGGTFLVFSDYLRPAIRLASLSKLAPIYVFTHDSIGLGEDGPTHQPVEHNAALRSVPGLTVIRPADANETVYAWKAAIENRMQPTAILLTRQKVEIIDRTKYASAEGTEKGAYVLKDANGEPNIILMASGSEVELALKAAETLESEGVNVRVVSFPSWELFEMQSDDYKESVLPSTVTKRLAIEAGIAQGWEKYSGADGKIISIEKFGASAPADKLFEEYGFTVENVVRIAKTIL